MSSKAKIEEEVIEEKAEIIDENEKIVEEKIKTIENKTTDNEFTAEKIPKEININIVDEFMKTQQKKNEQKDVEQNKGNCGCEICTVW